MKFKLLKSSSQFLLKFFFIFILVVFSAIASQLLDVDSATNLSSKENVSLSRIVAGPSKSNAAGCECSFWNYTCTYNASGDCTGTTTSVKITIPGTPAGNCDEGQSGNKCQHNGYTYDSAVCKANGDCEIDGENVGEGYCGCSGGSPPPSCNPGSNCDCTPPSCAEAFPGSSTTNTGPLCQIGQPVCSGEDDCGDDCEEEGAMCFNPENNVAPPMPPTIYYCVGGTTGDTGTCTPLSNDPASPTIVPLPTPGTRVYVKVNTLVVPPANSVQQGVTYGYIVDYLGDGGVGANCVTPGPNDTCPPWGPNNYSADLQGIINQQIGRNYAVYYRSAALNCAGAYVFSAQRNAYWKVNTPPQLISADAGTRNVGTSTDEVLRTSGTGTTCSNSTPNADKNPLTYTTTLRDVDGSADIDLFQLNLALAADAAPPNADPPDWRMRFLFAKDWDTNANNTFYILDGEIPQSSISDCHTASGGTVTRAPSNKWCFAVDSNHNFSNAASITSGGSTFYYLTSDIWAYMDGYKVKIKGSSTYTNATRIQYTSGTDAIATVIVEFDPVTFDADYDQFATDWELTTSSAFYYNVYLVSDFANTSDSTSNIGDTILSYNGYSFNRYGGTRIDLTGPSVSVATPRVIGATKVALDWVATDTLTGVYQTAGNAYVVEEGLTDNQIIKDITSNTQLQPWNPPPVPLPVPSTSNHLWKVTTTSPYPASSSRSEQIDFLSNEGSNIGFVVDSFDAVCNPGTPDTASQDLATPWLITKGGNLFSENGTKIELNPIQIGAGHYLTEQPRTNPTTPAYWTTTSETLHWSQPFQFRLGVPSEPNDIAISTELYSIGGTTDWQVDDAFTALGAARQNYNDPLNGPKYSEIYQLYLNALELDSTLAPITYNQNSIATPGANLNITAISATDSCTTTSAICIFVVDPPSNTFTVNSITSNSKVTCDVPALFFVSGNLTINPDLLTGTGKKSGCVFIANGDTIINKGADKPPVNAACTQANINNGTVSLTEDTDICYPSYDEINAFIMTDGTITINGDTDTTRLMYDGLRVNGSLIAFGGGSGQSIIWKNSLKQVNNLMFPALVVHHDLRYTAILRSVLRTKSSNYKLDTGFKPN